MRARGTAGKRFLLLHAYARVGTTMECSARDVRRASLLAFSSTECMFRKRTFWGQLLQMRVAHGVRRWA